MRLAIIIALCCIFSIVKAADYTDLDLVHPVHCRILDPDYCKFIAVLTSRDKCQGVGFEVSCDAKGECSKMSYKELERAYECERDLAIEERQKIDENNKGLLRDTQTNSDGTLLSLFESFSTIIGYFCMFFVAYFYIVFILTMLPPFLSPSQFSKYNICFDIFILLGAMYGFCLYLYMILF